MNIIVAGSRDFSDYALLEREMNKITEDLEDVTIFCGMARGADLLGKKWADEKGIPVKPFSPDYNKFGKRAPLVRNAQMIKEVGTGGLLVCFWDGNSTGTAHIMSLAKTYYVKTKLIKFEHKT